MRNFMGRFYRAAVALGLALGIMTGNAPVAQADHIYEGESFYGGWWMSDRVQGDMILGDGNGMGLSLGSTDRYCVRRGSGYSTMRNYISSNYPSWLDWYVDEVCNDGYVRVCVYNNRGNVACSTYRDYGWVRLD